MNPPLSEAAICIEVIASFIVSVVLQSDSDPLSLPAASGANTGSFMNAGLLNWRPKPDDMKALSASIAPGQYGSILPPVFNGD
jgi:hypothetical protein